MRHLHDILHKWQRLSVGRRQQIAHYIEVCAICIIIAIFIVSCFASCATPAHIIEYRDRVQHDTTTIVDSVIRDRWHTVERVADTVYIRDSVLLWKNRFVDKIVEVYQTDSIPYEVEVVKEVPKQLTPWQRFIMGSGYSFWAILILSIGSFVVGLILSRHV